MVKKFSSMFITTLTLVLFLTGCSNAFSPSPETSNSQGAYIIISAQELGNHHASGGTSQESRTISPSSPSLSSFENFVLSGSKGGTPEELATAANYSTLHSKKVRLDTGLWSFTLTAQCNGTVYTGEILSKEISSGANDLSFVLSPDPTGKGAFSLTLNFPASDVTKITARLESMAGTEERAEEELTFSSGSVTYSLDELSAGTYRIVVEFYGGVGGASFLNRYRELVHVAPGLTGSAVRTITSLNEVYDIKYEYNGGELKTGESAEESYTRRQSSPINLPVAVQDEKFFGGWYDNASCTGAKVTEIPVNATGDKKFYAKWLDPILYVDGTDGSDANSGFAETDALKTINQAMTVITETATAADTDYGDDVARPWIVYVKNSVSGPSSIDDTVPFASLTIQGKSGGSEPVLNGNGEGSVLKITSSKTVTLSKLIVMGGAAQDGAGLYKSGNGMLNIDGCQIKNNTATRYGGGIYFEGGSSAFDSLYITDTLIDSNKAQKTTSLSTDHGNGGGIYIMSGIVQLGRGPDLGTVTIQGNTASDYGGGICSKGYLNIKSVTISSNTASVYGGGIQATGSTVVFSGGRIQNNTASQLGGGISLSKNSSSTGAKLNLSGGLVGGNTAGQNGGGICVGASCELILDGSGVIGDSSVTSTASSASCSNKAVKGGGIYCEGSITSSAAFTGGIYANYASSSGGGIYTVSTGSVSITGGSISYNSAGSGTSGDGGGVYHSGSGTITLSRVTLSSNSAVLTGGGFCSAEDAGNETFINCTVEENTSGSNGGGIYLAGTELLTVENCTLQENSSENGGGLYICSDASAKVDGGTILDNTANLNGGGVWCGGTLDMTDGSVKGNKALASDHGGAGVYVMSGTFNLSGGSITNNAASSSSGGGVELYVAMSDRPSGTSTFTMTGGSISGNSAKTDGGGVYVGEYATFNMNGGTIESNTALGKGKGVYNDAFMGMKGSALIKADNDVYLPAYVAPSVGITDPLYASQLAWRLISVTGTLSESSPVATITPESYSENPIARTKVLAYTAATSFTAYTQASKFAVTTQANGTEWNVYWGMGQVNGVLVKDGESVGEVRYVFTSGSDVLGYGYSAIMPAKTLSYAINSFTDKTAVDANGNPLNTIYILSDYEITATWLDMISGTNPVAYAVNIAGLKNNTEGSPVTITCNAVTGDAINVRSGQTLLLDSVNFTQSGTTQNDYAVIMVDEGAKLTMRNCTMDGIRDNGGCAALHVDGDVTLSDVTIKNCVSADQGGWSGAVNIKMGTLTLKGKVDISSNIDTQTVPQESNVWIGFQQDSPPVHEFHPLVIDGDITGSKIGIKHGETLTATPLAITSGYTLGGNSVLDAASIFTSDNGNYIVVEEGEACLSQTASISYGIVPVESYDYDALDQNETTGYAKVMFKMQSTSDSSVLMKEYSYKVKDFLGIVVASGSSSTNSSAIEIDLPPLQSMTLEIEAESNDGNEVEFTKTCSVLAKHIWASSSGSDTSSESAGLGTKDHPYATLAKAVSAVHCPSASAIVHVMGQISGNTDIDSFDANYLTIEGSTDSSTDILNGNNNGTVLTVSAAKSVELKNIKVTGGRKIASDESDLTDVTGYGGGIFVKSGATLVLEDGVLITQNVSTNGGGVLSMGTLNIYAGAQISDNEAKSGGGILNYMGTVNIFGGTISQNTALYESSLPQSGSGGGILNWGSCSINATDPALISNNTAQAVGGGIMQYRGSLTLGNNCVISENQDSSGAGALFVDADSTEVTLKNSVSIPYGTSNGILLADGQALTLGSATLSSDFTAIIAVNEPYETGRSVLTVTNSSDLQTWVGSNLSKFTLGKAGWTIDQNGKLAWNKAGSMAISSNEVTLSLSSSSVSSTADTKLDINFFVDGIDSTTDMDADTFVVKVYSGASDITSSSYVQTNLVTGGEKSVTIKGGLPAGTELTVFVSVIYNMALHSGSFNIIVEDTP